MKLTKKDYKNLLIYYKINIPKNISYKKIKNLGENLLAKKLCKCIKKIDLKNEKKSIAICRNSIFNKKYLNFTNFTCKKKNKLFNLNKTKKFSNKYNFK
jgi:hypothetical protein